MQIVIRINVLSDLSKTFDVIITDDNGTSLEVPLEATDEAHANAEVDTIHVALEAGFKKHIAWNDTFERQS